MRKKCMALVLCLVLFSSPFVCAQENEVQQVKSEWLTQAEILNSLGLLNNYQPENFGFYSMISRAEFIDTIVNFYVDYSSNSSTGYSDVPKDHWAAASVALAAEMNLISPAANFNPDNEILYTEAIKVAVCVLGYGQIAEQDGGYPEGYLKYASKLRIANNLSGEGFCRGDMITLIYNMLDAEVMEVAGFGSSVQKFERGDKLFQALGYESITGAVVANSVVSIKGAPLKSKSEIQIEDITLVWEESNDIVGRRVECYYKYDSEIEKNVGVYINCIDEGVLKIKEKDITSLTSAQIKYCNENGDIKKLTLSGALEIVYNGRREASLPENLFIPQNGWIELVDYDEDGVYDVLFIYSVEEYVVSIYNSVDGLIYDKIDRSRCVNVEVDFLEVYINGALSDIDSVAQGSLISVAESRDGRVKKIYASTNVVSGQAEEYGDNYIVLDGVEYEFTKEFIANKFYSVSLKDSNNYYINAFGDISYATAANSKLYGYLIGVKKEGSLDPTSQVKMLNNEGVVKVYDTAEKIRLNGSSVKSANLASSSLLFSSGSSGTSAFMPQLCTYTLNSNGLINAINVVGTNTDILNELVCSYDGSEDGILLRSYKTSQMMLNKYVLTAATKVFLIADDDRDMMVTTPSSLSADTHYNAILYDWEDAVVGAMVIDNRDGSSGSIYINTESVPVVVAKVMRAIDDETGDETTRIYAYQNGTLIDMYPEDEYTCGNAAASLPGFVNIPFSSLKAGDVIQIATNATGRISGFRLLFGMNRGMDGATEVTYSDSNASNLTGTLKDKYAKMYNLYGRITDIYSDTLFKVNAFLGTDQELNGNKREDFDRILQMGSGKIYMYDSKKNTVSVMTPSEMLIDDMIYARTRYVLTEEIYVVR